MVQFFILPNVGAMITAVKQDENASTDLVDFLGNWVEVEEKARFGEVVHFLFHL